MSAYDIEQMDGVSHDVEDMVHHGHASDELYNGVVCNYKKFSLIIKDCEKNIVGILIAYTAYAEIYVDDIWVKPEHRGQNLGRKLLQHLEDQFNGKGYNNINLVTSAFQAPEFYLKCGFKQEFVRQNKHNPKLSKTFFVKFFDDAEQVQGIMTS